jgi:hypothetical protein
MSRNSDAVRAGIRRFTPLEPELRPACPPSALSMPLVPQPPTGLVSAPTAHPTGARWKCKQGTNWELFSTILEPPGINTNFPIVAPEGRRRLPAEWKGLSHAREAPVRLRRERRSDGAASGVFRSEPPPPGGSPGRSRPAGPRDRTGTVIRSSDPTPPGPLPRPRAERACRARVRSAGSGGLPRGWWPTRRCWSRCGWA